MRIYYFLLLSFLLLNSCNETTVEKQNDTDTTAVITKTEPIKPLQDSFLIDGSNSSFKCTRSKTVKDVDKQIKIGKSVMNLKMDNASFSANTDIKIKNGCWFTLDKKPDGGKVVLDMKRVSALQIGKDEEIESGNPGYLETKKYPTSTLKILHIDSIPGDSKKLKVFCSLQIKDTTGEVSFPAIVEYADISNPSVPTKLTGDFRINGIAWKLNPINAKVIKDDLDFHIVLVTAK
ncbi:hypothetical protein BH09BAC5_BH09BAC5_25970 [soil metagenome]